MSLKDPNVVDPRNKKRVAIVLSNAAISSTTGWPVGFWWSELSHPYFVLTERGYDVEVFSPEGGKCEADAMSDPRDPSDYSSADLISMGFIATPKLSALIHNTKKVSEIELNRFDAILVAGGQGPMFTFEKATALHKKFVEFYANAMISACVTQSATDAIFALPAVSANLFRVLWRGFAVRDGNLVRGSLLRRCQERFWSIARTPLARGRPWITLPDRAGSRSRCLSQAPK